MAEKTRDTPLAVTQDIGKRMTRPPTQKYHSCPSCDKVFSKQDHAHRHLKSHTRSKPQCVICKKQFKTKKNLNNHMKTHIDAEKRHACSICGRRFRRTHDVFRHKSARHKASQAARTDLTPAISAQGRHTDMRDEQITGHRRDEDNAESAGTNSNPLPEVDDENDWLHALWKVRCFAASARHTANHEEMAEHLSKITDLL